MTGLQLLGIIMVGVGYVGGIAFAAWYANELELTLIPKLKKKVLGLIERVHVRYSDDAYRKFQQSRYDARKRENRPWGEN